MVTGEDEGVSLRKENGEEKGLWPNMYVYVYIYKFIKFAVYIFYKL